MGEAGRKLTIRMPDNPSLRNVEVGQLHVDPGGRVAVGAPVMSLAARKRKHIVRAPRPGRVVPLVAIGDSIQPGDPLYTLHIDEEALAAAKREERALVPAGKGRWSSGITPDVIEPILRAKKDRPEPPSAMSNFVAAWGKPILAIALYVLACFVLLPILHTFSRGASAVVLIGMCVFSVMFAAMIYYLYRSDGGPWPRWTVRLIAASWIGISAVAIFYRPDVSRDITVADASATLGELFSFEQAPEEPVTPAAIAAPEAVLASGVTRGRDLPSAIPTYTLPSSVLAEAADGLTPHGVSVRSWARVNPTSTSGEALAFSQGDVSLAVPDAAQPMLASVPLTILAEADVLSEAQMDVPGALVLAETGAMTLIPVILGEGPAVPSTHPAPTLNLEPDVAPFPWTLVGLGEAPPQTLDVRVAALAPETTPWLSENAIPVIMSDVGTIPDLQDQTFGGLALARAPVPPPEPSGLGHTKSPGMILLAALRAGEDGWMLDQADSLAEARAGEEPIVVAAASDAAPGGPRNAELSVDIPAPGEAEAPVLLAEGAQIALLGPVSTLPDPTGVLSEASNIALGLISSAEAVRARIEPEDLILASAPSGLPRVPQPGLPPEPEPQIAERVLLYLYFDDPRLESHPKVGDPWDALVSPDAASAVLETRVEAVNEVIEVTNWCAAANDPDGIKEQNLPGGAYRAAMLSDRIRLLQVRVQFDPDKLDLFEGEVPVFDGAPPGFFHNKMPLMGGEPDEPVMARAEDYLHNASNSEIDLNTPPDIDGGHYFASSEALLSALKDAGCSYAVWNQGEGPTNQIGRDMARKIDG